MFTGHGELSGRDWSAIKYSAARRNIGFDPNLTIEFAWELYLKQDKKCNLSGLPITINRSSKINNTASLDRIDSSLGYCETNIQWLHKNVNSMKASLSNMETIELCRKIFLQDLENRRPSWPEYFIHIAYLTATRSRDNSTKCGCVITDQDHKIISTGYNGCFQNIDDSLVPQTRPLKYSYVIHSEMNAVLFAKRDLNNCYAFITGLPCENCCKTLLQAGICKIYYGNRLAKMCEGTDTIIRKLCDLKNVPLIKIEI